MTLPKFEQGRRIDLVTAVNELSESTQAAFDDLEVDVPVASPDVAGVVKVGSGLSIKQDGTLSADVTKDYVANEVAGVEAHLDAFEEETAEQISNESTARQNGDEQLENALSDEEIARKAGDATLETALQTVKSGLEKNIDDNLAICTNGLTSINNDLNKNSVKKVSATNGITASIATGTNAGATLNVGVKVGNGLSVNNTTGMLEVPVDTSAGLGYGSSGLEVKVDETFITFSDGKITANPDTFLDLPAMFGGKLHSHGTHVVCGIWTITSTFSDTAGHYISGFGTSLALCISTLKLSASAAEKAILSLTTTEPVSWVNGISFESWATPIYGVSYLPNGGKLELRATNQDMQHFELWLDTTSNLPTDAALPVNIVIGL